MEIEKAREINAACLEHVLYHMCLRDEEPTSLSGYSLPELIQARDMTVAEHEKSKGFQDMFCDDRLLAALYVAYHYEGQDSTQEPLLAVATGNGNMVFVTNKPRSCRVCGCTDSQPCEGGCKWVEDGVSLSRTLDLCSCCFDKERVPA